MADRTALLQLGKIGDCLNILPLARKLTEERGYPIGFVVGREFSDALAGVGYVTPVVYPGKFTEVTAAREWAVRQGWNNVIQAQVYGNGIKIPKTTSSFALEAWKQAGRLQDYGGDLVIDIRDQHRERALKRLLPKGGKPNILVMADAQSSPFRFRQQLFDVLQCNFGDQVNIVNLGPVRAPHFHDLLGLYEEAIALVCVDTGHLHLANAMPELPVFAYITGEPSLWHGAPQRKSHKFYCRYNDFMARRGDLIQAMSSTLGLDPHATLSDNEPREQTFSGLAPCVSIARESGKPRVWQIWTATGEPPPAAKRRIEFARDTWKHEAEAHGNWQEIRFGDADAKRDSLRVGDNMPVPFVKDIIDRAIIHAAEDDIVLLCNSDVALVRGGGLEIVELASRHGAVFTHRWDVQRFGKPLETKQEVMRGVWYPGSDIFAFRVSWLRAHLDDLPDFLFGREAWDWVTREWVKENGGVEVHAVVYHEYHDSFWKHGQNRANNQGNIYNRSWARAWLSLRKIPLKELTNAPYYSVEWKGAPQQGKQSVVPVEVLESARKLDVVVVLGAGSKWQNNELRYCLRGLERHAVGLGRVYVVGHNPGFLSNRVTHLAIQEPNTSKEHNITWAIQEACKRLPLSDDFVFFNDDHFLIDQFILDGYPYYSKGTLEHGIIHCTATGYKRSLQNTFNCLRAHGHPTESYEVHVPIVYNRNKFLVLGKFWEMSCHTPGGFVARSIYVNALGLKGPRLPDLKVRNCAGADDLTQIVRGRNVFSVADSAIHQGVDEYLARMYPNKSKYES